MKAAAARHARSGGLKRRMARQITGEPGCRERPHVKRVHVEDGRKLPRPCARRAAEWLLRQATSGRAAAGAAAHLRCNAAWSEQRTPPRRALSRALASSRVALLLPPHCGQPSSSGLLGTLQLGPDVVTAALHVAALARTSATLQSRQESQPCGRARILPSDLRWSNCVENCLLLTASLVQVDTRSSGGTAAVR